MAILGYLVIIYSLIKVLSFFYEIFDIHKPLSEQEIYYQTKIQMLKYTICEPEFIVPLFLIGCFLLLIVFNILEAEKVFISLFFWIPLLMTLFQLFFLILNYYTKIQADKNRDEYKKNYNERNNKNI